MIKPTDSKSPVRSMSAEIADLDALLSAKESFAKRVGLLPFTAGAVFAVVAIIALRVIA